jgi:hypothetical protein
MKKTLKITREELARYVVIRGELSNHPQNIYNMTNEEQARDAMDFHYKIRGQISTSYPVYPVSWKVMILTLTFIIDTWVSELC